MKERKTQTKYVTDASAWPDTFAIAFGSAYAMFDNFKVSKGIQP
jgi:hypothetical protein